MKSSKFTGWFSDVGFTSRVLIICDYLLEMAETWGAEEGSPFMQAVIETMETAQLEMARWEEIARAAGYLRADQEGTTRIFPPEVPPSEV
jgi:hypothetical protein